MYTWPVAVTVNASCPPCSVPRISLRLGLPDSKPDAHAVTIIVIIRWSSYNACIVGEQHFAQCMGLRFFPPPAHFATQCLPPHLLPLLIFIRWICTVRSMMAASVMKSFSATLITTVKTCSAATARSHTAAEYPGLIRTYPSARIHTAACILAYRCRKLADYGEHSRWHTKLSYERP